MRQNERCVSVRAAAVACAMCCALAAAAIDDGTFAEAPLLPANQDVGVYDAVFSDWDHDGDDDIILTSVPPTSGLYVIENVNGAFPNPPELLASVVPSEPTAADLNGDGWVDLIVGERVYVNDAGVPVLVDEPDFGAPPRLADMDGDGDLDAVAEALWLNDGSGVFVEGVSLASGWKLLGDVDGDGSMDVLNGVSIWLSDGAGALTEIDVVVDGPPLEVLLATADVNHDGMTDIAYSSDAFVYVAFGDGAGGFGSAVEVASVAPSPEMQPGGQVRFVATFFDPDADGHPDILVTPSSDGSVGARVSGVLQLAYGDGDGGFGDGANIASGMLMTSALAGIDPFSVGDPNGDGREDLLIANWGVATRSCASAEFSLHSSGLLLLYGQCRRDIETPRGVEIAPEGSFIACGDPARNAATTVIDGDVIVVLHDGETVIATPLVEPIGGGPVIEGDFSAFARGIGIAALDDSGRFAYVTKDAVIQAELSWSAASRSGSWTIGPELASLGFEATGMTASDFDGDGDVDLVVYDNNNASLLRQNITGGFDLEPIAGVAPGAPSAASSGDIDGDGNADLVFVYAYFDSACPCPATQVDAHLGDGMGGFTLVDALDLGPGTFARVRLADLDGDADAEIVVLKGRENSQVLVYDIVGGAAVEMQSIAIEDLADGTLVMGDADADGDVDVGVVRQNTWLMGDYAPEFDERVVFFENVGGMLSSVGTEVVVPESPRFGFLLDHDGDGDNDLVTYAPVVALLTVSRNRTIIPGRADVTGDGFVGFDDLNWLLDAWGASGAGCPAADVNRDGVIGFDDLHLLLEDWGTGGD